MNDTYQLICADEMYSLRVYRHGLRSRDEIDFEVSLLNYLKERGADVAYPVARREGGYVSELQAPEGLRHVLLTTHAKGCEPGYCGRKAIYENDARLFGASVAELHDLSDDFKTGHKRPRLETEYLLDTSLDIIRPFLQDNLADLTCMDDMAIELHRIVDSVPMSKLDVGVCHGDCHGSNVHNDNGSLTHFDFDCCGFGFRVFELATFKWGVLEDSNGDELWSSFLEGYRSKRNIGAEDLALVDCFVIIRHIWWMALETGNARDSGRSEVSSEFINHHLARTRTLFRQLVLANPLVHSNT